MKKDLKHIGNIKIDPINVKHKYGEYGILIGDKTQWGKGFAIEASMRVFDFCFSSEVDLRKINLGVNQINLNAVNLFAASDLFAESEVLIVLFNISSACFNNSE